MADPAKDRRRSPWVDFLTPTEMKEEGSELLAARILKVAYDLFDLSVFNEGDSGLWMIEQAIPQSNHGVMSKLCPNVVRDQFLQKIAKCCSGLPFLHKDGVPHDSIGSRRKTFKAYEVFGGPTEVR
ncbi:hypothetical protein U1Q18_039585 [Sarracenia purpurea var. burkii]